MASTQSDAARDKARSLVLEKLKSWEPDEQLLILVHEMEEKDARRATSSSTKRTQRRRRRLQY